jgi:hypothetical protein
MKLNYDGKSAGVYRKAFIENYETKYDKNAFDEFEEALHVWYGLDYLNFSAATPNYQYQFETVRSLLHNSLINSGIGTL